MKKIFQSSGQMLTLFEKIFSPGLCRDDACGAEELNHRYREEDCGHK